ncbi:MAG: E2/UBC family protein [Phycisphaerales bacterium]
MIPALQQEVDCLRVRGVEVEILEHAGQTYVLASRVAAPSPPWDRQAYDILIAVPLLFDQASLDAFYVALPYKFQDGKHERVNGPVIRIRDREWQLVSWHYLDGKPWKSGLDTLETHIEHCKGFFLTRGVRP